GGGNGQLGNGTTAIAGGDPQPVGTSTNWASVRAGGGFSMGIQADGTLWGWGANSISQLGDGTTTTRSSPVKIGTATDWAVVAPSPSATLTTNGFTMAIKTNGTLWGWGLGTGGQLGDGASTSRTTPTQIGADADWSKIATGSAHTLAIKANGSLWAAGTNSNGQLGDGSTTTRTAFVQIGSATDWASVATYGSSSYAIKTNGTLWAWGLNSTGQLGDGSTTQRTAPVQIGTDTNWLQVAGGSAHAAAIKTTGTLWVWGTCFGHADAEYDADWH
ncbi:MAG: chromosome condensation regulator RCC1, partial [Verrucomicrobia bacterium]|nr:chromosome condensation regulator RCC1 [Verrucomicrobiota bacterium]